MELYTVDNYLTKDTDRAKVLCGTQQVDNTKVNGILTKDKEKALNGLRTVTLISAPLFKINQMDKAFIRGRMVRFMMDSGLEELSKDTVFGED